MSVEKHDQIIEKCVESLKTWKQLIVEYLDEESNSELDKLKQVTKDYCSIESNFEKSLKALQKVENELDDGDKSTKDIKKLYENHFKNEPEPCDDYTNHEIWERVLSDVTDVMEVRQKQTTLDEDQYEEVDDSLLCSNVFTPPIDPMSKMVIRNPYKNKKCKHVYEHSTIVSYIKQLRRKAKCPYIGCKNTQLLMSDLIQDAQLQTQISEYIQTQTVDEENDDE